MVKMTPKERDTKKLLYFNANSQLIKPYNIVDIMDPLTGERFVEIEDTVIPASLNAVFPMDFQVWIENFRDNPALILVNAALIKQAKAKVKAELIANLAANKDW